MKSRSKPGVGGLVLARKLGECIYIGRDIMVTVTELRPGQHGGPGEVKLHIAAPPHIQVSRGNFPIETHLERQRIRDLNEGR